MRERARSWTPAQKLEYLQREVIGNCQRCQLCRTRQRIVFGVGDPQADLMFIGEAPGADEDRQGIPFVGRAGQRLTRWIEGLGLSRDRVYIANVLKCRPPRNRDPQPVEVARCSPFLQAQIRAIQPRVIVALGRHAGNLLLERSGPPLSLRNMRGRSLTYTQRAAGIEVPLLVTYHPSYVLRRESEELRQQGGRLEGPSAAERAVLADLRAALPLLRARA